MIVYFSSTGNCKHIVEKSAAEFNDKTQSIQQSDNIHLSRGESILKTKGLPLSLAYSIKTVDDWTVWFDTNNKDEIDAILRNEDAQIKEAINLIKSETIGNKAKNTLPMTAVIGSNIFYNKAKKNQASSFRGGVHRLRNL